MPRPKKKNEEEEKIPATNAADPGENPQPPALPAETGASVAAPTPKTPLPAPKIGVEDRLYAAYLVGHILHQCSSYTMTTDTMVEVQEWLANELAEKKSK